MKCVPFSLKHTLQRNKKHNFPSGSRKEAGSCTERKRGSAGESESENMMASFARQKSLLTLEPDGMRLALFSPKRPLTMMMIWNKLLLLAVNLSLISMQHSTCSIETHHLLHMPSLWRVLVLGVFWGYAADVQFSSVKSSDTSTWWGAPIQMQIAIYSRPAKVGSGGEVEIRVFPLEKLAPLQKLNQSALLRSY